MSLLEVEDLHKTYPSRQRGGDPVQALKGVSIHIEAGETLAVIGESGSGKSTLGRAVLRLIDADSGTIRFDDTDLGTLNHTAARPDADRLPGTLRVSEPAPVNRLDRRRASPDP
jgi:ABC-type oligopeptide transport system ATPase subunit